MLALTSPWDWTEIIEGTIVSLLFVLAPVLWRVEKHHRELRAHAQHQSMLAEEQHYAVHHPGQLHPRVQARLDRGEDHTPTLETA
jgi:hypothetical protein